MGVLTEPDGDLLALSCDAYSLWRRARAALRKIQPTDEEYHKVGISVEKACAQMRLLADEFGFIERTRSAYRIRL